MKFITRGSAVPSHADSRYSYVNTDCGFFAISAVMAEYAWCQSLAEIVPFL